MVYFQILAGGYDVFVATYLFNSDALSLSVTGRSPTGNSPSWIFQHFSTPNILYAVNEVANGAVQSFIIGPDGTLSEAQDTSSTGGDSPAFAVALSTCAVALSTCAVAAVNYGSGNGRVIPTTNSGLEFDQNSPLITFPKPNGPISHPHMVVEHDDEILIPDLGQDTIWRLARNTSDIYTIHGSIPSKAGSGPRHIAIHEDRLFVLHEISSTLTVQEIPAAPNGTSRIISDVSTFPADSPAEAMFAAAEILIPKPTKRFPKAFIYTSNRNTGAEDPRGDSIAIFELIDKDTPYEKLQLVNQVYTGLDQIRGMEFGPSSKRAEEFLVAAGDAGDAGVIMLRRTEGGRNMEIVARNLDIPTRTTFVWL